MGNAAQSKSKILSGSSQKSPDNHQRILIWIVVGIFIGILFGGLFPSIAIHVSILGELFLNALMMIVVPLVMSSMIVGITGLGDIRKLGSIGKHTIIYYLMTTGLSVLIGITLVNILQPGSQVSSGETHPAYTYEIRGEDDHQIVLTNGRLQDVDYNQKYKLILMDQDISGIIDSVSQDLIKVKFWQPKIQDDIFFFKPQSGDKLPFRLKAGRLVPAEPELKSAGQGFKISLSGAQELMHREGSNIFTTLKEVLVGDKETNSEGIIPRNLFNAMLRMEILPLIVFSLLIGAALSVLGKPGQPVIQFISGLNDALMQLISWIMKVAPFGIFGLIASRIGEAGGFSGFLPELIAVGKYSLTVLIGLSIHGIIILPLILILFAKRNPLHYLAGVAPALLNAFSTASSSASLPLTLTGVEQQNRISDKTASFVLPLGATINMDGTALYEAVAAMFIAQVYAIQLGPVEQTIIFLTATLAAIGAAGIPQAGLVTMVIVLKAVNLPIEGIGIILTIDWLLDRFRTTVNVWGDSIGAAVVDTLEAKKI